MALAPRPEASLTDVNEAQEVWDALMAAPRSINPKYFYDDLGSELFEQITRLEEYYPTRTELALLESVAAEIISTARPRELVELGAGAGRKVHLLMDAMQAGGLLERCVLLDINETFVERSVDRLAEDYPKASIDGVVADFTEELGLPDTDAPRLILFLAGTFGNLPPAGSRRFLDRVGRAMKESDRLLIGLDLVKPVEVLERAYNDADGVTAAFNRNIVSVLNDRFATNFAADAFEHVAFWDADNEWVEMRLRARRPMRVVMPGDPRALVLATGDEIRTELSCKFSRVSFAERAAASGLAIERWDTDPDDLFALVLVRKQ
jgi:L-histidine N-alpha-methyltransferase